MKEEQYWITISQWTNIIFSDLFESNHVRNINLDSIELQETETKGCILIDHKFWGKIRITYSVEEYSLTIEAINICKIPLEWADDFKKEIQNEEYRYFILEPDGTLHSIFPASYNKDEIITEGALHSYRDFEKTMEQLYPTEIMEQSVSYPLKEGYSCHCTCKEAQSSRTVLRLREDHTIECSEISLEQCSKCAGYFLRCDYFSEYAIPSGTRYCFPVRGPGEGICLKELGFSYILSHITDYTEELYEV